ncbi:hypothetical protein MTBGP_11740 [Moorella thermoacetica]|uniref:XF1762 family protein n=1 Tax=Neomoorella thermoacetica TaxID=1525 RepID=UPI0030CE5BEA
MRVEIDWSGQMYFCDCDQRPPSAKLLYIKPIPWLIAKQFVELHHYLHYAPPGSKICLGVFYQEHFLGVLIFGRPIARLEDQLETLELSRMVLLDICPKNSESRSLGLAARWIKKNMPWVRRLISYADPGQGHTGTIYRAAGWNFVRKTSKGRWTRRGRLRRDNAVGVKFKFEKLL